MKAIWNGQIVAESDDTVVLEGNHYFPEESIRQEFFQESDHTSVCPWKGLAHYRHLKVDGLLNANAAWVYPDPKEDAKEIAGRYAFWKGVSVER
jgi:uncharacterized protein (DUF427 family)